jgi:thioredoxin-related protein
MAQEYKVRSVPTMVLVDDTGREIRRQVGMVTEEKLLEFLKG